MKTGQDILNIARPHAEANDPYIFGAMKPVADFASHKPFDCSKFVSCCVYGGTGLIYGCENDQGDPWHQYGGTVYWYRDATTLGRIVTPEQAAAIPGAAVLRYADHETCHHIVLSDGQGGTIEAACARLGVVFGNLHGRIWTMGILPPGVDFGTLPAPQPIEPPAFILRLWSMGPQVAQVQRALGIEDDGVYGPITLKAVRDFQIKQGDLVVDGMVGPATWKALGL